MPSIAHDISFQHNRPEDERTGICVHTLAAQAIRIVASRSGKRSRPVDIEYLDELQKAVLSPDAAACEVVARKMIEAGVPREEIADEYIPAVARRMGDAWCSDVVSFSQVTIGTSRLQNLLRVIGPEWMGGLISDANAPSALVLVSRDCDHTLGAMVLVGQLRRRGLSVDLILGVTPESVKDLLTKDKSETRYDTILLSAAVGERLATLRDLIKTVRDSLKPAPPIILGGTILQAEADILGMTGADLLTSDPEMVLKLSGMKTPSQAVVPDAVKD